jgi:hypothetical protein
MVFFTRRQVNRMRTGQGLALLLSAVVLVGVVRSYSSADELAQMILLVLGGLSLAMIGIAVVQLISFRGPSKVILFHQPEQMVIATNQLYDSFKLRYFRDMLNDNLYHFSDSERQEWSALKEEGFHAVFKVRETRKTQLLPMLCLLFDQVYVLDHTNRWDYFDCQNTSEPTHSTRGVGPLSDESVLPQTKRQPAT